MSVLLCGSTLHPKICWYKDCFELKVFRKQQIQGRWELVFLNKDEPLYRSSLPRTGHQQRPPPHVFYKNCSLTLRFLATCAPSIARGQLLESSVLMSSSICMVVQRGSIQVAYHRFCVVPNLSGHV